MTANQTDDSDRPFRGKRISWAEFYKQHPHLRPANDNKIDTASIGQNLPSLERGGKNSSPSQNSS